MTSLKKYVMMKMKGGQNDINYINDEGMELVESSSFLDKLKKKGYKVLFMVDAIDEHVVGHLSMAGDLSSTGEINYWQNIARDFAVVIVRVWVECGRLIEVFMYQGMICAKVGERKLEDYYDGANERLNNWLIWLEILVPEICCLFIKESFTYVAVICLLLLWIPISMVWVYIEELHLSLGQDSLVSIEVGRYVVGLIPALLPYAFLYFLGCYLQAQTLISTGISYWLNLALLLYVIFSPSCAEMRPCFPRDVLWDFRGFCRDFAGMTSVMSARLTIPSLHYHIPYSLGAVGSTLVGNEQGMRRERESL